MFKECLKSISILFHYAKKETLGKIVQMILVALISPLSLYITQRLIDNIGLFIAGKNGKWIVIQWGLLLMLSMIFLSSNVFIDNILNIKIKRILNQTFTSDIISKFKSMEYSCFENSNMLNTINRMGANPQEKIIDIFNSTMESLTQFFMMVGTAVIFAQVSVWFAIGFLVLLLPMIWFNFKGMDLLNNMYNNQSESERWMRYYAGLMSEKNALVELKVFKAVECINKKWKYKADNVLKERIEITIKAQKYYGLSKLIFKIWTFFVAIILILHLINGNISIGIFTALMTSTGKILDNSVALSKNFSTLSQKYIEISQYYKFMDFPIEKEYSKENFDTQLENRQDMTIGFENVSFYYPNDNGEKKEIIKNVSFQVKSSESIAIVGENGAGKSTIVKLLCGLYQPTGGKITINGIDMKYLSREEFRKVISVVFQDYAKYELSLRENIGFGDVSRINQDQELIKALDIGMAKGLLELSPKGLDANMGKLNNDGIDLSGGQWQRLAIARACFADSAFVILDEPTAAMDPVAESQMYHSFIAALQNKGSIIISHRLASAKIADKIVVIKNGMVEEIGSHEELMSRDGVYKKMFIAQSSWYIEPTM